jgi:hypothetical protein
MDYGLRRLVLAVFCLLIAGWLALESRTNAGTLALAVGLVVGWVAARVLLATRPATGAPRPNRRGVQIGIPIGVGIAAVASSLTGAIDPEAPKVLAAAALAFAAGALFSLRFSDLGDRQI